MAGRIVLFGATGYTGRLTAEAFVARGTRPVLAARSKQRVEELAAELGGLESEVADVARPASVDALVEAGDVLVTTVGPFTRYGEPAVEAAIRTGAHYLDSTGEAAFIRRVFQDFGPRAQAAGCGLLTAFGADWVPGNLAGALALHEAGVEGARVDIAYFATGPAAGGFSGGTRASAAASIAEPGFGWRGGRLVTEWLGRRVRDFEVDGAVRPAVSVGASEHFALPRLSPGLLEVNVYLGWFGPASRPLQAISAFTAGVRSLPAGSALLGALASAAARGGSTGGPDAAARARTGGHFVAIAYDAGGRELAEVRLRSGNMYEFTAAILAWGAERAAAGGLRGTGALGPADGFGLEELEAGCAECGLRRM